LLRGNGAEGSSRAASRWRAPGAAVGRRAG
jgi:hypothetical protein